jgi:succinate dehydrogenase/fumarate reductase flavoprotein subunit
MTDHYDLVVLGSGSTAFAAAIRAAELGKTAVMTEARTAFMGRWLGGMVGGREGRWCEGGSGGPGISRKGAR